MRYIVRTEENSRYGDESERRTVGEFEDAAGALCAARRRVDEDLESLYRPGMTPDQLFRHYTTFGEDAYIVSDDPDCQSSAYDYAREKCKEICNRPPEHNV